MSDNEYDEVTLRELQNIGNALTKDLLKVVQEYIYIFRKRDNTADGFSTACTIVLFSLNDAIMSLMMSMHKTDSPKTMLKTVRRFCGLLMERARTNISETHEDPEDEVDDARKVIEKAVLSIIFNGGSPPPEIEVVAYTTAAITEKN